MFEIKNRRIVQETPTNFEWPEYKNDRERIKFFSEKFKNTSIEDAFTSTYGVKIQLHPSIAEIINDTPMEVSVGEIIKVKLVSVNKEGVTLSYGNVKENIICRNNLWKYARFQGNFSPIDLEAKIISTDKKQTIVDIIEPLYDDWRNEIINFPQWQNNMEEDQSTLVKDLKLIKGGYICKVDVPNIHKFVGEPYYVDAFIPGSQIVLNIENKFEKWEGASVRAFVTNFMPSPSNPTKQVAVCSVKRYLQHIGNINMYNLFSHYAEGQDGTDYWKNFTKEPITGIVTGIINSSEKCGVFVELPLYNITGMIPMSATDIVKFAPQTSIMVNVVGFNLPSYYNDTVGQVQHTPPYIVDKNGVGQKIMVKCDLKPVLKLVQ